MGALAWAVRITLLASFAIGVVVFIFWKKTIQEQYLGKRFTTTPPFETFNYTTSRLKVGELALQYKKCMTWISRHTTNITDENYLDYYHKSTHRCIIKNDLNNVTVVPHQSNTERLLNVYPKKADGEITVIVEIGWSKDIEIEKQIRRRISRDSEIFVADSELPDNRTSFKKIATYVDISVAAYRNATSSSELQSSTTTMDVISFITQVVRRLRIDQLAVNSAESSANIIPQLLKTGSFEKNGIVVCQLNFKINVKDYGRVAPVLRQLTFDNRYIPLRIVSKQENMHIFMVNVEKPHCVDRYLANYF